ncbi:Rpn family recombination-promoting nuclease/putative transposase, partial [Selenomonas sp.]|uniref:Rpn family recombination-promoting nuclease/putative transposase n=1 Tax=Selenomonas sp. TaxID=2053611 RepID=UPI003FA1E178
MDDYRIKPWEELTIRDDYMFKLVMNCRRICKKMLEGTLRIKIKKIHYVETEKSIASHYQSKGIRLDVYVKDEQNTVYNIEMQIRRLQGDALFKRTRYYQSMMDVDLLAAGADYDELNKTIIIFICAFDPFGEERYIYTFENLCAENKELKLRDGTKKIFLNTKGRFGDIDSTIKAFLQYVDGVVTDNALVQEIEKEIQKVKLEEGERVNYMTFAMKMMEERK